MFGKQRILVEIKGSDWGWNEAVAQKADRVASENRLHWRACDPCAPLVVVINVRIIIVVITFHIIVVSILVIIIVVLITVIYYIDCNYHNILVVIS